MAATVEKKGRRYYLRGLPYEQRGRAKNVGCRWDPEEKAWWSGKEETARSVIAQPSSPVSPEPKKDFRREQLAGRATYKGRQYYVAGRVDRRYGEVEPVVTRDGAKVLLYFRDGSSSFWAAQDLVKTIKEYRGAQTIASIARFVESRKNSQGPSDDGYSMVQGCQSCRDIGRMCKQCEFDEYDM